MTTEFGALSLTELSRTLGSRTRAIAARRWLYASRPAPSALPARVPGVAPEPWAALRETTGLPAWQQRERLVSADGTIKYRLGFETAEIETVLIPAPQRSTVCVSSQAGCTRACTFCATATLGFSRQLTAGEIVMQYVVAQADAPTTAPARNVVFMGMGEPMDNLDAVMAAVDRLTEESYPCLAAGHVTVSTSGILPGMRRFLKEGKGRLALSLNATTDALRERLMPQNRLWPIALLIEALREDQRRHAGRRYFIEYVLWEGVNDTPDDARRLIELLRGVRAHVNLIPHNPFPESTLRPAAESAVLRFQQVLQENRVRALLRLPRGREIAAACGQLARRAASA